MSRLSPKRAPLGWLAAGAMLVVGFVVGLTVTSGGGGRSPAILHGTMSTPISAAAPAAAMRGPNFSYAPVASAAMPSVVNISTDKKIKAQDWVHPFMDDPFFRRFFGEPNEQQNQNQSRVEHSLGSGVIVRSDGYILTSNHVVEQGDKIRVLLSDNVEYDAKIVGQDPQTDVALIKVDARDLPAIRLGDSDAMQIGDQVMAIGNPFGIGQTATLGIISALGRSLGMLDYEDFIQTDASINPGNSGGALVNMDGELVGINTAILSRSGGSQGVGFAIPSNMAKQIMTSLIAHGKVQRAQLGVQIQNIDQAMAEAHGLKSPHGVLIADVIKGASAQKAGLRAGDVILAVNGKDVQDVSHMRNQISLSDIGSTVDLRVLRDGREMNVPVRLEEMQPPAQTAEAPGGGEGEEEEGSIAKGLDGVKVQALTQERRGELTLPNDLAGVVVTDVDETSNAFQEGLRPGDVITDVARQPVRTVSDFRRLVGKDSDKPVLLRVYRKDARGQGGRVFMAIPR